MAIGLNHDTRVGFYLAGTPVQVVQIVYNGTNITSSSSFSVITGLNTNINLKYVDSKVLIVFNGTSYVNNINTSTTAIYGIRRTIGVTDSDLFTTDYVKDYRSTSGVFQLQDTLNLTFLDTPNTLSTITYKFIQRCTGGANIGIGWGANSNHTMTLMEIQQ
jgi:hypothetical protein